MLLTLEPHSNPQLSQIASVPFAQVVVEQGQVLDGAPLLPAITHTIDTQPGDTGVYLFQCDVQVCDWPVPGLQSI